MMDAAYRVSKRRKKKRRSLQSFKRRHRRQGRPTIRFTPYAWAKLLYLRDAGDTEIGGFGITAPDDLLLVEDVQLVKQLCTAVTVEFHDESVADFFDEQVDAGLQPGRFGRIWLHTHPGDCPDPSTTDEETFDRCFGTVDWAVMFILALGGKTFSRLQFNVGPQTSQRMKVEVEYSRPFDASDESAWQKEYEANVVRSPFGSRSNHSHNGETVDDLSFDAGSSDEEWLNQFDSDPLFLDWEDDTCPQRLSPIPV